MGGLNEVLAVLLMAAKFGGNVSDIQAIKSNLYEIKSFWVLKKVTLLLYDHLLTIQHSLTGLVGIHK